ncbi:DCN1-like protein 5, partial [Coemansia sp. S17]
MARSTATSKRAAAAAAIDNDGEMDTANTRPVKKARAPSAKAALATKPTTAAGQREYQDYNRDDGRQVIGLEGFQRLCDALKCDMEGLEPMVLSWKLGADELGTVELETWDSKICEMGVTDNAALKKAIDTTVAKFKTDFASYRSFYRKMFDYLKTTPNQKLVPVENVKETLALITNQHWLFMRFIEFLNAQGKA